MPGQRSDGQKIALAIEGGGMRGCVAAGMVTAVWYLGLDDAVDVVYGSSAGSLVGAYFITKQLPYDGPEIYYDVLTSAGDEFIDPVAIIRSMGLGILDLRIQSLVDLAKDRLGKPVLNLDYLLGPIIKSIKPINWDVFWDKQQTGAQPLKIVTSGVITQRPHVLSAATGNFQTLDELAECLKASMLLPGVTGEFARLKVSL
jgi:predicted acylesterase/phospholipase RssA